MNLKARKAMPHWIRILASLSFLALGVLPAHAQSSGPIDRDYEAAKGIEITSIKLQLATLPGATAVQELTEAEDLLRRLRATQGAAERRKLASQLDLAVARLHMVADTANTGGR